MDTYSDNDEIPLPLVRRAHRSARTSAEDLSEPPSESQYVDHSAILEDRMSPAMSGGIIGFFAGEAFLAVVHAIEPAALTRPIAAVGAARGVEVNGVFGIAYATSAAIGALVGATFAVVTRYLRRWFPLLIWAVVFFVSLAMLLLATSSVYGRGVGPALTGPVLLASLAFGCLVSFSLPIRRRR